MDQAGWENRNQQSAPLGNDISLPETVTVVDPRHPLYDQTFLLLHLTNAQNLIRCCVVQLTPHVDRLIPITATSLAPTSPVVFPSPVDLSSLQRLVTTFRSILAARAAEGRDESAGTTFSQPASASADDLGDAHHHPTSGSPPATRAPVLSSAQSMDTGAQS